MGNRGMQCKTRDRGMGSENVDKRLHYFLVEEYDETISIFDSLNADEQQSLLAALKINEDQIHMGAFKTESALSMLNSHQKQALNDIIKSIEQQ